MNSPRIITIKFVLFYENHLSPAEIHAIIERFGPAKWKLCTVPVSAPMAQWEALGARFTPDGKTDQEFYKWFRNSAVVPVTMGLVQSFGWPATQGISEDVIQPSANEIIQMFALARDRRLSENAKKAKEAELGAIAAADAEAYGLRAGGHLAEAAEAHYDIRSGVIEHVIGRIGELVGSKPDLIIQSKLHQPRESPPAAALELHTRINGAIQRMRASDTMLIPLPPSMTIKLHRVSYVDLNEGFFTAIVVEGRMAGVFPRYGIWIIQNGKR